MAARLSRPFASSCHQIATLDTRYCIARMTENERLSVTAAVIGRGGCVVGLITLGMSQVRASRVSAEVSRS